MLPLRTSAVILVTLTSGFVIAKPLVAQQTSVPSVAANQADPDKIDARVFALLFIRENKYLQIAKNASSPNTPEAHLNRALPTRLHLDSVEAASLEQMAAGWASEVKPIRAQMTATIKSFHASFPNGRLNPGIDPTPPASLATLRAQIDTITLQYRDQLRNALPEATFQSLQTKVRQEFSPGSISSPQPPASSQTGGLQ